jgi:serine/threonine protein kinase
MASAPRRCVANRFEIIKLIGEGAFARVYRARDATEGRNVALKILKEAFRTDAEILERFRREAFAVASIDSPHVVSLYDFGVSGDEMFIAMEYIEGPTLRELAAAREWDARSLRLVVGQIAEAVAAAHKQNIVHRDLKPENVVLVRRASGHQVKVLDFGLAKLVELERNLGLARLTQAGMCFGTPQYMSPEQIQGRAADTAADLWSLAVIAYELLAGYLPWDGPDAHSVLLDVLQTPIAAIRRAHPSVARLDELNRLFGRALGKDRAARPANATAFFAEFDRALSGATRRANEPVFSGIVSKEFVLPDRDDYDTLEEPRPPGQSRTSEMFDDTARGDPTAVDRNRSTPRHLHSGWMTSPQSETETTSSEPGGLYAPEHSARSAESGKPHRRHSVTQVVVRAPRPRAAALLSRTLLVVITALALVAGLAGYWVGGG